MIYQKISFNLYWYLQLSNRPLCATRSETTNLTEEEEYEEGGKSEDETENEAIKDADEYDKDHVNEVDCIPDE